VHQPIAERFNEAPIIFLTVCTQNRKRILANSEVVVLLRDYGIRRPVGRWDASSSCLIICTCFARQWKISRAR